ncbi:MAG: hypothetical protein F6K37_25510 [Moorea sp. SIO4E2]|uniref:hypothetical protein n=1 Tax=Moorena sp. SIO4E2 TaxID=2607826 RepID=UPI0013B95027|nr:hypothetical protein [Moorena sp. SIO4E2]NEQ09179.1 hypothetical protein [Moorena sp. SIO4E2]
MPICRFMALRNTRLITNTIGNLALIPMKSGFDNVINPSKEGALTCPSGFLVAENRIDLKNPSAFHKINGSDVIPGITSINNKAMKVSFTGLSSDDCQAQIR